MSATVTSIRAAERLLFDLAGELRFVPVDGRSTRVHLRALELKREVRNWEKLEPDARTVEAVLDEIERLANEARRLRRDGARADASLVVPRVA